MSGRFFDAWTVGDRIEHALHRTVTETDNLLITTLTHNPQPLHLDADYAGATEFGRIVVFIALELAFYGMAGLCYARFPFGRADHDARLVSAARG